MALSEKLQYLITVDSAGAVKGFQNVGKAAEKELGKAENRLDKVGARMTKFGAGALASAGVVGAGLLKTANAFQDLAIESGKLADTTGLTVDAASRWIEVAGDMGVETATVESSLNKMNKTLGGSPALFEKYGVEIAKAADGTTDVNQTFLNVVDRLNAIQDPADRAAAATALLGKGWTGMSELIATGSASLSQSLAQVSDAKVINPDELARAKQYRASLDALSDAFQDIVIGVGQGAAPALGNLATIVASGVNAFGKLDAVTGGAAGQFATFGVAGLGLVGVASSVIGQVIKMRSNFASLGERSRAAAAGVGMLTTALLASQAVDAATGTGAFADYTDQLNAYISSTAPGVKEANSEIRSSFDNLANKVSGSTGIMGSAWSGLGDIFSNNKVGTDLRKSGIEDAFEMILAQGPKAAQAAIDAFRELDPSDLTKAYGISQDQLAKWQSRVDNSTKAAAVLGGELDTKTTPAIKAVATSTERAKDAAEDLERAWSKLKGEIDDEQSWLNLQDRFDDVRAAAADAFYAASSGAADADQKQRSYQESLNAMKLGVIDYAAEVLKLPPERVTKLLVNAQDVDAVEQQLAILTRNRTISVELVKKGGIGWDVWVDPNGNRINARAAGGQISAGEPYLVGERGPELVVPATSGTVIPAARTQAIMAETAPATAGVTVIVQGSIFGDQALRRTFADLDREQRWKARVAG